MPESNQDVLAIRVSGKLSKADCEGLHSWLHDQLAMRACPAMLIVMENFEGWEDVEALVEDAKIDAAHHDDLRRVAMVGESAWQKWMTRIAAPLAEAEVRYFDLREVTEARAWLQGT